DVGDVVLLEDRPGLAEGEVVAPQRGPREAADEGADPQPRPPVPAVLLDRQAHQRLEAREGDRPPPAPVPGGQPDAVRPPRLPPRPTQAHPRAAQSGPIISRKRLLSLATARANSLLGEPRARIAPGVPAGVSPERGRGGSTARRGAVNRGRLAPRSVSAGR